MEYNVETNKFGDKVYYKKWTQFFHREDGPAVEFASGSKVWYINGMRHRVGGPAVEWCNGNKEWWVNGERMSPEKEIILNKWWSSKNGI